MSDKPIPSISELTPGQELADTPQPTTWQEDVLNFMSQGKANVRPEVQIAPRKALDEAGLDTQYLERLQSYRESSVKLSEVPKDSPQTSPLLKRLDDWGVLSRLQNPDIYGDPIEMATDALHTLVAVDDVLGGPLRAPLADLMAGKTPEWGAGDMTISEALVRSYGGPEQMARRLEESGEGKAAKLLGPLTRSLFFGILTPLGVFLGPGRTPKAVKEAVEAAEGLTKGAKAAEAGKIAEGGKAKGVDLPRHRVTPGPTPGPGRMTEQTLEEAKTSSKLNDELTAFAKEYEIAPTVDPDARPAWEGLMADTETRYATLEKKIKFIPVADDAPYKTPKEMFDDIDKGEMKISTLHSEHPFWTPEQNFKFRAVHDYTGHYLAGNDFSMAGENLAYKKHSSLIKDKAMKAALDVEIRGQAAYAMKAGAFGEQKAYIRGKNYDSPTKQVMRSLEKSDGATVSLTRGDLTEAGVEEWGVGIFPERRKFFERPIFEKDVEEAIEFNKDVLSDPRVSLGVWKDDKGVYHMEPSYGTKSREQAVALGKQFDQISVMNTKTGEIVGTGGSGRPDISKLPALHLRLGTEDKPGLVDQLSGLSPLADQFNIIAAPEVDAIRRISQGAEASPQKVARHSQVMGAAVIHNGARTLGQFRKVMSEQLPDSVKSGFTPQKWESLYEKSRARYTSLMETFVAEGLPSANKIQQLFKKGEFNKAWYNTFKEETDVLFGNAPITLPSGVVTDDADMFRRFFAATSSRTAVERESRKGAANVERAMAAFVEWKTGKPFSSEFTGHLPNLERVSQGLPFEHTSPKVQSFYLNLSGDPNAVTVDGRTARIFGMTEDNVNHAKYQFVQELIRRAAIKAGEDPREFQAAMWTADKLIRGEMEGIARPVTDVLYTDLQKILRENPALLDDVTNGAEILQRANKRRPGFLDDEAGLSALGPTMLLARLMVGAASGAAVGDEEDRLRNALLGAGLFGFVTPSNLKAIADVLRANKAVPSKTPFLATAEGQRLARAAKLDKAMPLSQMALDYQTTLKELHEVRHQKAVMEEAELLANYGTMDKARLEAMLGGEMLNDAELGAAYIVMSRSFQNIQDIAMAGLRNPSNPELEAEYLKALLTHGKADIGRLRGSVESGRAVGIHKVIEPETTFLRDASDLISRHKGGQDVRRLMELTVRIPSPTAIATAARVASKPGLSDMILEAWVLGLVSGLKTFTVNTLGNTGFLALNMVERGVASLYGGDIHIGEVVAGTHGMLKSFNSSLMAAWHVLKSGDIPPSALEKYDVVRKNITADNVQDLYAMRKLGIHLFDDKGNPNVLGQAVDLVGEAARLPARVMLAPSDVFFRGLAIDAEIYMQAFREARLEASTRGLTGQAFEDYLKAKYTQFAANPSDPMMRAAHDFGAYVVFQRELGEAGRAVQALTQASNAAKFILPFVRTPGNITKVTFLERTPLAPLSRVFRDKIAAGGPEADLAMARLSLGSMGMAFMAMLAGIGIVTGNMPTNREAGRMMIQNGWQAGSINLTKLSRIATGSDEGPDPQPGDFYIRIDRTDPHGAQMVMAADFVQIVDSLDESDVSELAAALAISTAKTAASRSWIRGISEIAVGVSDPDRYGESVLRRFAGTFIPFSGMTAGVTRELDPTIRDAQSILDEYKKKVWPFSNDVIPVRDIFANIQVYPPGVGPDIASPFYAVKYKGHPVLEAAKADNVIIGGVGDQFPVGDGAMIPMEPLETDRLRVLAGREIKDTAGRNYEKAMLDVIDRAKRLKLSTGPDSWRAQEFRRVTSTFRQKAREQLLDEFPSLKKAVNETQEGLRRARGIPSLSPEQISVR